MLEFDVGMSAIEILRTSYSTCIVKRVLNTFSLCWTLAECLFIWEHFFTWRSYSWSCMYEYVDLRWWHKRARKECLSRSQFRSPLPCILTHQVYLQPDHGSYIVFAALVSFRTFPIISGCRWQRRSHSVCRSVFQNREWNNNPCWVSLVQNMKASIKYGAFLDSL